MMAAVPLGMNRQALSVSTRSRQGGGTRRYAFDDYILDAQRYELHRTGKRMPLRPKPFEVLTYVLAHRDRIVPKDELLEHLWAGQFVGDATLNTCIKEVRRAIGDSGAVPRLLRTVRGRG